MSRSERKAVLKRFEKDCLRAAKHRVSNRKLRDEIASNAGLQDSVRGRLLQDLHRVYEHPDNPYSGFAASRQRYRQLGHFPESLVEDFFGNHSEFLRAADLQDTRTTSRVKNKAARLHTHQQVARYAKKHVLKWVGRHQKAKGRRRHIEAIFASDFHSEQSDPFALDVLEQAVRTVSPDHLVLGGDIFDFPQVSSHRKLPGHFHLNLQQEIDWGKQNILRRFREAAPSAQIDFIIGNHEYRLVNYIADCAPAMASLNSIDFNQLFGLDELEINLVCRSSFLAPYSKGRKRDIAENWSVIGGCWVVTHGTSIARWAAASEIERFRMSGTSGHTHRPQWVTDNSLGTGPVSWMSAPMMAGFGVGRDYVPNPSAWNMGFVHASVFPEKGLVHQQPVTIFDHWAVFSGQSYVPSKRALDRRRKQYEVG